MSNYTLFDAIAQAAKTPDTFNVPPNWELCQIKIGDFIKIGIEVEDAPLERVWLKVTATDAVDRFIGTLANTLFFSEEPGFDTTIVCERKHLYDIRDGHTMLGEMETAKFQHKFRKDLEDLQKEKQRLLKKQKTIRRRLRELGNEIPQAKKFIDN